MSNLSIYVHITTVVVSAIYVDARRYWPAVGISRENNRYVSITDVEPADYPIIIYVQYLL